jgi:hypothetical protein
MKNSYRFKTFAAIGAIVVLMAGCGSSSDDPAPPPTATLPSSVQEDQAASASVAGFVAFIQTMIASLTLETNEPRDIGGITPPASDSTEPAAI